MKITYIGFGDFHRFAGMKQLYHFAQETHRRGHQVQILVAGRSESVQSMNEPPVDSIVELAFTGPRLSARVRRKVENFDPDILHVWTPRFVPALAGWQIHQFTKAPVILDFEDDEDYHVRSVRDSWTQNWTTGIRRLAVPAIILRNTIMPWLRPLDRMGTATYLAQEPLTRQCIAKVTAAHTAISPNLTAWAKRQWPDKPSYLLYPGADLVRFRPQPKDSALVSQLHLDGHFVVTYLGTMSLAIFVWFLDILDEITAQNPKIVFLLVGEDGFRDQAKVMAAHRGLEEHYRLVGQLPYGEVPRYLGLGDILLQHPLDLGNEMRLPAKLPEYFAMGKPVVTYAQGIGTSLQDGLHVCKLYTQDPREAARVILLVSNDRPLAITLGENARQLACERFDWTKNGGILEGIYQQTTTGSLDRGTRNDGK